MPEITDANPPPRQTILDRQYDQRIKRLLERLDSGEERPMDELMLTILYTSDQQRAAIEAIPNVVEQLMREHGCPLFAEKPQGPAAVFRVRLRQIGPPAGYAGAGTILGALALKLIEHL